MCWSYAQIQISMLLLVSLQALLELEMNSDLKAQLRELNITAAKVGSLPESLFPPNFLFFDIDFTKS